MKLQFKKKLFVGFALITSASHADTSKIQGLSQDVEEQKFSERIQTEMLEQEFMRLSEIENIFQSHLQNIETVIEQDLLSDQSGEESANALLDKIKKIKAIKDLREFVRVELQAGLNRIHPELGGRLTQEDLSGVPYCQNSARQLLYQSINKELIKTKELERRLIDDLNNPSLYTNLKPFFDTVIGKASNLKGRIQEVIQELASFRKKPAICIWQTHQSELKTFQRRGCLKLPEKAHRDLELFQTMLDKSKECFKKANHTPLNGPSREKILEGFKERTVELSGFNRSLEIHPGGIVGAGIVGAK